MEFTEDLSYSNLVNLIQGEENKGSDLIYTCAVELENVRKQLVEIESKLNQIRLREQILLNAGQGIAKHLKRELPLSFKRQDCIIIISDKNLLIERNVI